MITKINVVNSNLVIVSYDNRSDFIIETDDGMAWHHTEYLLSPRWDMTYSEYLSILDMADNDTLEIEIKVA